MLLVGLGNPGSRYVRTPHNIGFEVADALVDGHRGGPWRSKFQGELASLVIEDQRVMVLKPQTYMNLSGFSVRSAAAFYRLTVEDIAVIHDELDLPAGQVRLKCGGGDAGHHGLESLSEHLGSSDYLRVRCGIGRPPPQFQGTVADYLLEPFPEAREAEARQLVKDATCAVARLIVLGPSAAMNQINRKIKS